MNQLSSIRRGSINVSCCYLCEKWCTKITQPKSLTPEVHQTFHGRPWLFLMMWSVKSKVPDFPSVVWHGDVTRGRLTPPWTGLRGIFLYNRTNKLTTLPILGFQNSRSRARLQCLLDSKCLDKGCNSIVSQLMWSRAWWENERFNVSWEVESLESLEGSSPDLPI
jgi:hypothetical protein